MTVSAEREGSRGSSSFRISVITVVRDSAKALEATIGSISSQRRYGADIEYIVVDGASTDGTVVVAQKYGEVVDKFISEPDQGVYDAMNKGLDVATGEGILFLNAGDRLCGNVFGGVTTAPLFFPVFYTDILGRRRPVKVTSERYGIPNCHQGILFPRSERRYDLTYRICADYDFFLRHGYDSTIPMHTAGGYVWFSPGMSSERYVERDREIFEIRKGEFGPVIAALYEWRNASKRQVRRILRLGSGLRRLWRSVAGVWIQGRQV